MDYKTYIFDFDFTLADAATGIVESINYALGKLGLPPESSGDIKKTVGMTLKETFFKLTHISDKEKADLFVSHFKDMADKVMAASTVLFGDTIESLSTLKRNNRNTAVVTSKFRYRIEEVLNNYGIPELIGYIVGFEDVASAKPSPEGLLKAAGYFGGDKKSVLYIGDSLIDANTAKNAKIDFAAVTTGTTAREEFLDLPHVCIADNLTGLLNWVGEL